MNDIKILFIGDIFGKSGIEKVKKELPKLIVEENIDFVIAQSENVTGRKGFGKKDYETLKKININAFTIGNHVWANKEIYDFIEDNEVIRPLNIDKNYPGSGSRIFTIKGAKIKVVSLLGISFNELLNPWKQKNANNFFDAIDKEINKKDYDYLFVDFHAETTSEKYVLGLYLDKLGVDAMVGTHTHVQTNDAKIMENNMAFICDVGMTGPKNSAIGANFNEVYQKMRYNSKVSFKASTNDSVFNAVLITLKKNNNKIKTITIQ